MGRTAKTQRLTALAVRKYAEDTSARAPLHDGGGLYLRKRGVALHWTLRLTDPATGADQWHRLFPDDPLGTYPHKGLADARAEARRLWSTRSSGIDPRAERQRQIRARVEADTQERLAHERRITVRALFDRWAATELQPRVLADGSRLGRKDAGAFTKAQFERRVFPKIGSAAVEDVKRADLLTILDGAKAEGKLRTANVLLSDLKQMFRFALMRDLVVRNPLDTVGKREVGGPSVERDRVLSPEEIRQLSAALPSSGLQQRFVAGVWIVLSTGARVGELIGATWSGPGHDHARLQTVADKSGVKLGFVDLDRRTWYLPETKNQRDHTIHLSDFALRHFRALAVGIPGHRRQRSGRLEDVRQATQRSATRAAAPTAWAHEGDLVVVAAGWPVDGSRSASYCRDADGEPRHQRRRDRRVLESPHRKSRAANVCARPAQRRTGPRVRCTRSAPAVPDDRSAAKEVGSPTETRCC
jgi:hypothetical protein